MTETQVSIILPPFPSHEDVIICQPDWLREQVLDELTAQAQQLDMGY